MIERTLKVTIIASVMSLITQTFTKMAEKRHSLFLIFYIFKYLKYCRDANSDQDEYQEDQYDK
jgi:hypothetical protein